MFCVKGVRDSYELIIKFCSKFRGRHIVDIVSKNDEFFSIRLFISVEEREPTWFSGRNP